MTETVNSSGPFVGVDRSVVVLAVGDIVALVSLLVVGLLSHDTNPITEPVASLETMAPFLLGWIVLSVLAGIYDRTVATSVARTARLTTVTWFAAANVGLVVRSSPYFDGGVAWPFGLVMTGTGLIIMVGWRVGYAALATKR